MPIAPLETDPLAFAARVRRKLGEPSAIANLVAYDAVVPSCFGDDWALLTDAQRLEVSILLRRLMEKTLDARRKKTTSYDTAVTVLSEDAQGARVRTLSRARANPTEPSWRIDFVLHRSPEGFRVVDVVTEGSSMVKNYRDQFHEMLRRDDQGYDYLARKLRAKVERT